MTRDSPRTTPFRVLAVLRSGDQAILGGLAAQQCVVVGAPLDALERTVSVERVSGVVLDADLPGVFEAVQRLRKTGSVASALPVAFVGAPDLAFVVGEFLQRHGPGFFSPRPVSTQDLAVRLKALFESDVQLHRGRVSPSGSISPTSAMGAARNTPQPGTPMVRSPAMTMPRKVTPVPVIPTPTTSPLRAPTPPPKGAIPAAIAPFATTPSIYTTERISVTPSLPESPLTQAASPALRPGSVAPSVWNPPSLSAPLTSLLRSALSDVGASVDGFSLPSAASEDLDDLVPPELLEPLEEPFESLVDDASIDGTRGGFSGTSPGVSSRRAAAPRTSAAAGVTPLPVEGDLKLSGTLGRYGVPWLLSAATRVRATGVIFIRSRNAQWQISLHSGHVLAVRGSRPEDLIGSLLARLGYLPHEAARFAEVPLDAGVRGASLLAARGYLAPDGVSPMLARAAQELLFDLYCLDSIEWEIRALESSVGIPMQTRSPDSLLVLGARARIEPVAAYSALGGDGTSLTLRAEASAIASLPLTQTERAAASAARDTSITQVMRTHGDAVLPALLALHWLGHLRVEGPAHDERGATGMPGPERTRLRALAEAARRKDLVAVLGVSPFATRAASINALEVRRAEVDAIRARAPTAELLPIITAAIDDLARILGDSVAWERYVSALRASQLRDEG